MHNELRDFINSKSLVDTRGKALTYGDGPTGSIPLRQTLASFFTEYFRPVHELTLDQLMVTNGVTATIEHSSWALANPGEGILLGRPYYRAFIADISLRTGVKVVPVSFGSINPLGKECVLKYEEALIESNKAGVKVRALMLCHPHNPLGRCYPKETIIGLMRLCQKYKIHLISDEIYALSVWKNTVDELDNEPIGFESVLSIDTADIIDPELVHVLWGTSKDFGANGIRLGVIISQTNTSFLMACRTCSLYSAPSSLTENAVANILSDKKFLETYIASNQEKLSKAYSHAVHLLQKHGIAHQQGVNAAFFLWIDLGSKYREQHADALESDNPQAITETIFEKLMEKKVYVVQGSVTGAEEPGWFRLVFSQPEDVVAEGITRIAEALR